MENIKLFKVTMSHKEMLHGDLLAKPYRVVYVTAISFEEASTQVINLFGSFLPDSGRLSANTYIESIKILAEYKSIPLKHSPVLHLLLKENKMENQEDIKLFKVTMYGDLLAEQYKIIYVVAISFEEAGIQVMNMFKSFPASGHLIDKIFIENIEVLAEYKSIPLKHSPVLHLLLMEYDKE